MPYKDADKQREFNRQWFKRNPQAGANTPLAREVLSLIASSDHPIRPAEILRGLTRKTTPGTISVTLARLRLSGHIRSLGYGKWVARSHSESPERSQ